MRKNKKLFAILTLVAFMMTLMPTFAFATGGTTVVATGTVADNGNLTVTGAAAAIPADGVVRVVASVSSTADNLDTAAANGSATSGVSISAAGTVTVTTAALSGLTDNHYIVVFGAGASSASEDVLAKYQVTAAIKTESANKAAANTAKTQYDTYKADTSNKAGSLATLATTLAGLTGDQADIFNARVAADNVTVASLRALDTEVSTFTASDAYTQYPNNNTTTSAQYTAFKTAYGNLSDGAKDVLGNTTAPKTKIAGYDVTDAVLTAWDAYKADVDSEAKLISYKIKTTNDPAFLSIINKRTPAEGTAAAAVAQASTPATAKVILEEAGITSGGSTPVNPVTPPGVASVDASIIATVDANANIEANGTAKPDGNGGLVYSEDKGATWKALPDTKYEEIDLVFKAANGGNATAKYPVYIWAEENGKSGQATDAFVLNVGSKTNSATNVYVISDGLKTGSNTLKAAFLRGGNFTIKASFEEPWDATDSNRIKSNVAVLKTVTNKTAITATAVAQETRKFYINVAQGPRSNETEVAKGLTDGRKTTEDAYKVGDGILNVSADTVATTRVVLTVYNGSGNPMSTYPIRLSTNSANIELDKTSVTTDYNAQAVFNVAGIREGEYKIYVTIGDYESTIIVNVGATSANDIQLIKFPSHPIATDTLETDYKDVFRFQLTDANGNIVKGNYNGSSYAAMTASTSEKSSEEQAKYAYIVSAPEANKVKNADLKLEWVKDKDYYTLSVDSNKAFTAEGDYEIRVVLNNGKSATLNFTVKKFDKAVSLHIEYPTQAVELNSETDTPDIYFLDASRVMKKANNRVTVAAQGFAVASVEPSGQNAGKLWIKNDEKYIGQTITVTAASDKENLMASTTLTVADEAREVKLDTNRGPVNANNRVGFKVVDSNGTPVALGKDALVEVTAVVTNTGDQDAKVSYSVTGSSRAELQEKGTGVINLSANKQTTATVQIMVKVTKNTGNANTSGTNNTGLSTTYYSGTETFTFGAEADKSVVMTIGSKEIVAQNVPVTIDVAPFIQDNRTYVPFRALVEAFGADVDYNADNNTVTTKLDGKTVVLTVGSTVLTVNDETVTMDVAPFIVDDRVVVPVRFVGEAFGFTVEATQDADTGATASVVFYQK